MSPRSIPTTASVSGMRVRSCAGSVSATNEQKYRPAASLTTVTVEGTDGSTRDHFTRTLPIFGNDRSPPGVTDQRAFAVKRIACRLSFRDLNRGAPMRGRFPLSPSKKFRYAVSRSRRDCCSTTADTSPSHDRASVLFASVSAFDSTPDGTNGRPAERASSRARKASLYTTRAHPNARASAERWGPFG